MQDDKKQSSHIIHKYVPAALLVILFYFLIDRFTGFLSIVSAFMDILRILHNAIRDGQKVWSYPESANNRLSFFASPAVADTHVYAGTFSNQLHVLNKEDGTLAASVEVYGKAVFSRD